MKALKLLPFAFLWLSLLIGGGDIQRIAVPENKPQGKVCAENKLPENSQKQDEAASADSTSFESKPLKKEVSLISLPISVGNFTLPVAEADSRARAYERNRKMPR